MKLFKRKKTKSTVKTKKITDLKGNEIKVEKKENKKVSLKDKIKKHIKKYKKIYRLILLALIAVFVVLAIYVGIRNYMLFKKYGKYENAMNSYGYSILYNNESPKSYEKVTKVEMVKIILSSIYNTTEIESRGFNTKGNFEGEEWVKAAEAFDIVKKEEINKDNYDEIATRKEAVIAYLNARSKLMDIPVSSKKESSFKNLQSYTQEERMYINDAVENGLIKNSKKKINLEEKMYKGQFNELVVKFVEEYNTVAPEGETIVTKKDSKPSNSDIYPYILYSVPKEVYEYELINENGVDYASPVETFKYRKDYYGQVEFRAEDYYNRILNIDYKTINKDTFVEETNYFLRFDYSDVIKEYVDYVIANKIVIEGTAQVQFPVFYLDGIRYRARIKLSFEIKNSNTDKNILLGDTYRATEVTYKNKKYEVYIDAPMGTTMLSKSLMLDMEPVIDLMVNDTKASEKNEF